MQHSIEELTKMADAFTVFSQAAKRLPLNAMSKLKHLDDASAALKITNKQLAKAQKSGAGAWGGLLGLAIGLALAKGLFDNEPDRTR